MQPRHAAQAARRKRDESEANERARLLYLQPSSTFGGAERQASIAVPLLAKLGFDVTTMMGPSTSGLDWLREYGVEDSDPHADFPGGWPQAARPRAARAAGALSALRPARRRPTFDRVARERRADIIYAAMAFSWIAATPVARQLGIPIVWRAGGTEGGRSSGWPCGRGRR